MNGNISMTTNTLKTVAIAADVSTFIRKMPLEINPARLDIRANIKGDSQHVDPDCKKAYEDSKIVLLQVVDSDSGLELPNSRIRTTFSSGNFYDSLPLLSHLGLTVGATMVWAATPATKENPARTSEENFAIYCEQGRLKQRGKLQLLPPQSEIDRRYDSLTANFWSWLTVTNAAGVTVLQLPALYTIFRAAIGHLVTSKTGELLVSNVLLPGDEPMDVAGWTYKIQELADGNGYVTYSLDPTPETAAA
jgi:hypothetical protein